MGKKRNGKGNGETEERTKPVGLFTTEETWNITALFPNKILGKRVYEVKTFIVTTICKMDTNKAAISINSEIGTLNSPLPFLMQIIRNTKTERPPELNRKEKMIPANVLL
jgi:hypothetical protein